MLFPMATSSATMSQQPPTTDTPAPAVLLVDDHDLFRAGLRQLLEGQGIRVVGDARCTAGALDMARRTKATIALFDATTVDGDSTTDLVTQLTDELPEIGVIMFTRSTEPLDIYRSVRAGARGYLAKEAPVEQLAGAIRAVAYGAAWMQPTIIATVLDFIRTSQHPVPPRSDMSEREVEVLRLIATGMDNNEIAATLDISPKTVKNHVSNILMKLGVTNRVQAAVFAVRSGIA
jgi:DNA-binding NarL/FixJ family response regulator